MNAQRCIDLSHALAISTVISGIAMDRDLRNVNYDAYDMGQNAFSNGIDITKVPALFFNNETLVKSWVKGFNSAKKKYNQDLFESHFPEY